MSLEEEGREAVHKTRVGDVIPARENGKQAL